MGKLMSKKNTQAEKTFGRHVASAQEQAVGISDLEEADGPPARPKRTKKRKKVAY